MALNQWIKRGLAGRATKNADRCWRGEECKVALMSFRASEDGRSERPRAVRDAAGVVRTSRLPCSKSEDQKAVGLRAHVQCRALLAC